MEMKERNEVSKLFQVEPILLDGRLFSATRRPRLIWTNIPLNSKILDKHFPSIILNDIIEFPSAATETTARCITSSNGSEVWRSQARRSMTGELPSFQNNQVGANLILKNVMNPRAGFRNLLIDEAERTYKCLLFISCTLTVQTPTIRCTWTSPESNISHRDLS